jgi:flavin reductase (DIM6/NTAB) family NADH-FMN oxidoreductase RutF
VMIDFNPEEHSPAHRQGMLSQLINPRPIAMITTENPDGSTNVAPYSYYLPITGDPMLIGVTVGAHRSDGGGPKDTWVNIERTGEFVVNVTTASIREHIETAAMEFPPGVSELDETGWTTMPSVKVGAASLVESPAHMECRVHQVVELGSDAVVHSAVHFVVAEVVWATIDESICTPDHRVDPVGIATVGRMGFPWFVQSDESSMFQLPRYAYADWADERPVVDAVDR